MDKYEWKKAEKALYLPKEIPELVDVPKQNFFMISGKGNPNGADFSSRIEVLYSLAYAVRMMSKQGYTPDGYFEYTVYPLEGVWDLNDEGRQSDKLNKDQLFYTIMIRQPEFVTREVADKSLAIVEKKKPHPLLGEASFDTAEDGLCVQMLHIGSFDDEARSFEKMKQYISYSCLERTSLTHREIYLSDFRKTEPGKLKTVLRYFVKKI